MQISVRLEVGRPKSEVIDYVVRGSHPVTHTNHQPPQLHIDIKTIKP